ncbi:MAG: 3-hydroxyacyl-CoA dehydrogenase [Proteobacteria bacterium]|nr:3-hydroxyacyl-CoA dehydrogenase [Pseudomonadota bacterium]
MKTIAIIGSGLIGRAWSIVFARANHPVMLYDNVNGAVAQAIDLIGHGLADLKKYGLIDEDPEKILLRITPAQSIEEAVSNADYVQENTSENLDIKKGVFSSLDQFAPEHCILASSTSTIQTSLFSEHLAGRHRCIVAHPVNPPHIAPIVEVSPSPWTSSEVTQKTYDLHQSVGQAPIIVKKEVAGFILNRLQAALLREAWRLVDEDYVSVEDLDKTIKDGLGLRWAFMGPFETIDLNAPGGIADYAARFGDAYSEMMSNINYPNWTEELVKKVEAQRRDIMPFSEIRERESWRDQRLMALIAHKRNTKSHD